jgi:DNA-binding MarR family transcriptional regulator
VKKLSDSSYAQCLYFTTNALARKVEKMASLSWKKVNLSPSHGYLLMLVIDEPGIQPMALSADLHLKPSTITRLIEKLESKKLVVRTFEGKLTNVYPTPKGKELVPKLKQCVADFYESYAAVLGKQESGRLVKNLIRAADKFSA